MNKVTIENDVTELGPIAFGSLWIVDGVLQQLVNIGNNRVCLISLSKGEWWNGPFVVEDPNNLGFDEWLKVTGGTNNFRRLPPGTKVTIEVES